MLFHLAPKCAINMALQGFLTDHKVKPGNHISDALPIKRTKNHFKEKIFMTLGNHTRTIYVSFELYEDPYMFYSVLCNFCTKKFGIVSIKSYMILDYFK